MKSFVTNKNKINNKNENVYNTNEKVYNINVKYTIQRNTCTIWMDNINIYNAKGKD